MYVTERNYLFTKRKRSLIFSALKSSVIRPALYLQATTAGLLGPVVITTL